MNKKGKVLGSLLLILILILSSLFLVACDKDKIELNMSNWTDYLKLTAIQNGYMNPLKIEVHGVLNFALYEDVVITIKLRLHPKGNLMGGPDEFYLDQSFKLDASGGGEFKPDYSEKPEGIYPEYPYDQSPYISFVEVLNVSGTLRFIR